jgi:hypothetical protein
MPSLVRTPAASERAVKVQPPSLGLPFISRTFMFFLSTLFIRLYFLIDKNSIIGYYKEVVIPFQ